MPDTTRRGVALFAAMALTAVIGLLVAGAVATTRMSQRTWRVARTDASLTAAADYALSTVLGDASRLGLSDLAFGVARTIDVAISDAPGVRASVAVTRLRHGVLWLVSDVVAGDADQGHRRTNLVARFPSIGPRAPGGVVARGDIELASDVTFVADTSQDPGCLAERAATIVIAPGASVSGADSAHIAVSSVALDSTTYFVTASQLAALHSTGRFTHVRGDTTIAGGAFDGILIVDGSLTITGPFAAQGLIAARGPIVASSGPITLTGAVLSYAPQAAGKLAIKFSGVTIRYSGCVVDLALRRVLDPRSVSQRSWAEIF